MTRDWTAEQRESAAKMTGAPSRAGCPDPVPRVYSEVREGLPQQARFAVLRELFLLALAVVRKVSGGLDSE